MFCHLSDGWEKLCAFRDVSDVRPFFIGTNLLLAQNLRISAPVCRRFLPWVDSSDPIPLDIVSRLAVRESGQCSGLSGFPTTSREAFSNGLGPKESIHRGKSPADGLGSSDLYTHRFVSMPNGLISSAFVMCRIVSKKRYHWSYLYRCTTPLVMLHYIMYARDLCPSHKIHSRTERSTPSGGTRASWMRV